MLEIFTISAAKRCVGSSEVLLQRRFGAVCRFDHQSVSDGSIREVRKEMCLYVSGVPFDWFWGGYAED